MKIFVKINNSIVSVGDNIDVRIIVGGNSLFGPPERCAQSTDKIFQ